MNTEEALKQVFETFEPDVLIDFFRTIGVRTLNPLKRNYDIQADASFFCIPYLLGTIRLENEEELAVFTIKIVKSLTERSGKKAQYELAKKILKTENRYPAGIFIFHDDKNDFRFSLVYNVPLATGKRDWSNFRRYTYFVSKEQTNKTFLKQIGEGDFTTLDKIKEAFSVEPVTKQFYNEIQSWYFWAMDKISFPEDYTYSTDPTKDKEIRNATNLIRLITRIIFIWFLKEKDLVPSYLFSKEKLAKLVLDFVKDKKSYNFYNAILQNLFFATLNQKMNERKFTEDNGYPANKKEYGVKNLYRYADKLLIDKDKVLELFQDIPFLNDGLFDCLDKEDETGKVIYIDGFSRNIKKQANIPDYLFFQEGEERVDLSSYGIVSKPVRGLIDILNSYNFTIDENTPIDQEIALDPELLGKVFENLLASYNPETATTARKATGSYYTPREIVDYMVEASLFEYLKGKFPEIEEEKIKLLFSYSEEISEFSEEEKQKIITAIDEIKILDPACGSGAFPMGILHKLVFTLQKLDPENKHWYDLQYQKALKETEEVFKQGDKTQREERLKEINETFDENINYPDYARKLFLIENCIYGVDIQPIAIQISKLRFFISLVLDQKVDKEKENFGIRALPNLETKFVAANTLIGLNKPDHLFYTDSIKSLEDEIKALRHKYFTAKSRREKLEYQRNDRELREQLSQALKSIGFSSDSSEKIAKFDIYDQNASADWFDSEWMFGVTDGFDIVIGNPPYIDSETMVNIGLEDLRNYLINNLKFTRGNWDIYIAFFEVGFYLLNQSGIITFITPDKWISKPFGYELRKNLLSNYWIITESGRNVFESSNIDSIITFITKSEKDNISINKFTDKTVVKITDASKNSIVEPFTFDWLFSKHIQILNKIESLKSKLSDYGICENACATSDAYKLKTFIINVSEKTYSADKFLKVINTGTIDKYTNKWGKIEMTYLGNKYLFPAVERDKFLKEFTNTYGRKSIKQKIIIKGLTLLDACFDFNGSIIPGKSTLIITSLNEKNLKFLLGLLNSKLAIFYIKEKYRSSSYNQGINFNKGMINSFPIPQVTNTELTTIIALVDQILSAKERGEDTIALEREIDKLVYKLYDLTEEEIRIIENRK